MKMIKNLLILFSVSLFIQSQAQLSIGAKGGYSNSWEQYGNVELPQGANTDIDTYNVAILSYWKVGENVSLGSEPGIAQRGAACIPGWFPVFEGDTKLFVTYVDVPFMCKFDIPVISEKLWLSARFGAGPAIAVSAFEETIVSGGDDEPVRSDVVIGGRDVNRWDVGARSALAIEHSFSMGNIFVEGSYYHGFMDVAPFTTSKNRTLSLNLGYIFSLK